MFFWKLRAELLDTIAMHQPPTSKRQKNLSKHQKNLSFCFGITLNRFQTIARVSREYFRHLKDIFTGVLSIRVLQLEVDVSPLGETALTLSASEGIIPHWEGTE